jgi:dolichol-phosphate mannosyltransferase
MKKIFNANSTYRLLKRLSTINIPLDSGDFSFISRRVVDIMNQMPEESRYLRGMRSWIGFNQTGIEYERSERVAGKSKYPFRELLKLAYNGLFNFSEFQSLCRLSMVFLYLLKSSFMVVFPKVSPLYFSLYYFLAVFSFYAWV